VTLAYDPLGRLYQVTGASGTRRFIYDGTDRVGDADTVGNWVANYVYGPGADAPIVVHAQPAPVYLSSDERGSIISQSLDVTGAVVAINRYDEFGQPQSTNAGTFGYTGQAWIPDLKLWYYKARIYSPALGRFMQTDPIGYGSGPNLYAYVRGDPVNLSDPLGLQCNPAQTGSCDPIDIIGGGGGGLVGGGGGGGGGGSVGYEPPEGVPEAAIYGPPIIVTATRIKLVSSQPFSPGGGVRACQFAPLNPTDRDLANQLLSDPIILSALNVAWQKTTSTGHEWSFFVYSNPYAGPLSLFGRFSIGPIREGYENTISRLQEYEFRFATSAPLANVHTHPGSRPEAASPSTEDSKYNVRTHTLGILVTYKTLEIGRQCS